MEKNFWKKLFIVVLGCLVYIVGYYDKNCPGVLLKPMSESLKVSESKLGILASTYFWSYAFMQPFIGPLSDQFDSSYLLFISLLLSCIGSIVCALSRNFYLTCVSRFIAGIGGGCIYIPVVKTLSNWFSPKIFPYSQSIVIACGGLGGLLAQGLIGTAKGNSTWPIAYYIGSSMMLIIAILCILFMKGTPEGRITNTSRLSDIFKNLFQNIKEAMTFKDFWFLATWKFLTPAAFSSVSSTWGNSYLRMGFGFSQEKASQYISMTSIAWTICSPLMAFISNTLHTRKWSIFVCTVIGTICAFIFTFLKNEPAGWILLLLLFLFTMTTGTSMVLSVIFFKELHSPALVGTMMGCGNMFLLLGTAVQQDVTAAILPLYEDPATKTYPLVAYRYGLWLLTALSCLVSLLPIVFVHDTYNKAVSTVNSEPLLNE